MTPPDDEQVRILPLTVVTRSFAARPSSLPDVRDFVRRQLTGTPVADDDVRRLCDRVAEVLLEAAGVSGSIQVSLRIFPDSAEVDVLIAAERTAPPAARAVPTSPPAPLSNPTRPNSTRPNLTRPNLTRPNSIRPNSISPATPAIIAMPAQDGTVPGGNLPGGPPVTFAAWFAARLRREGLTMEAAARRLDVSAKTISRWVAGSTEPRLRDLLRIRENFGEPPLH